MAAIRDAVELRLWNAYLADRSDERRNALIEHYLPYVRGLASRFHARLPANAIDADDLLVAGVFGLMQAIGKFELSRGLQFTTFAQTRINGAMLDELRERDWVPRLVRSKASQVERARQVVEVDGRVDEGRLARQLGVTARELPPLLREAAAVGVVSLEQPSFETSRGPTLLADRLRDSAEPAGRRLDRADWLREVTRCLNQAERLVVILYYYEGLTMKEIGRSLGVSESRVSQVHTALLARLREVRPPAIAAAMPFRQLPRKGQRKVKRPRPKEQRKHRQQLAVAG